MKILWRSMGFLAMGLLAFSGSLLQRRWGWEDKGTLPPLPRKAARLPWRAPVQRSRTTVHPVVSNV